MTSLIGKPPKGDYFILMPDKTFTFGNESSFFYSGKYNLVTRRGFKTRNEAEVYIALMDKKWEAFIVQRCEVES